MPNEREVIDVDDPDLVCTGVRIDRRPSLRTGKHLRVPVAETDPCLLLPTSQHTELQRITQLELESRRAVHDVHLAKKRATDALKMAADAVNNLLERKRKEPEVIEISDDSEPETVPLKRQKLGDVAFVPPYEIDIRSRDTRFTPEHESGPSRAGCSPIPSSSGLSDDDDCMDLLASLDISNGANWVSPPEGSKAEDLTPMNNSDGNLFKPYSLPPFRRPRKKNPIDYRHVPDGWFSTVPWGTIAKNYGNTRFPKPFYHARRQDCIFPSRPPNLYLQKGYFKLELTAKYPHLTSGSINRIIQTRDTIVLCAVVEGGLEDSDDSDDDAEDRPPPRPENKPGALVVYHRGRVHVALAHRRLRDTSRGSVMKHYTVTDVAFNPHNPRQFLSSGKDHVVQAWEIDDDDEHNGLAKKCPLSLDVTPQELVYNSGGSALAITCLDGTVRLCSQDLFDDMTDAHFSPKRLYAAPRDSGHATGATLWGVGPSNHLLFTSSEPEDKDTYSGFHHAFDAHRGVQAVKFDATEAGDAATVSPDGTTLVLFTRGENKTHPIRLYDVRRKAKEAYETEELERFDVRPVIGCSQGLGDTEEVTQASFSPDGRLLAVARNDNALHVYDVRALSSGPLCRFEHHDSDHAGGGGFGIVEIRWIQGRSRTGIASGGNDGCVRLWEPALGKNEIQGTVLGRTDFDVGHFSMGDRQNGEFPLVIGDSGGSMHTYDFTNPNGTPI